MSKVVAGNVPQDASSQEPGNRLTLRSIFPIDSNTIQQRPSCYIPFLGST